MPGRAESGCRGAGGYKTRQMCSWEHNIRGSYLCGRWFYRLGLKLFGWCLAHGLEEGVKAEGAEELPVVHWERSPPWSLEGQQAFGNLELPVLAVSSFSGLWLLSVQQSFGELGSWDGPCPLGDAEE